MASLLLVGGAGALAAQADGAAPPNITSISPNHGPLTGGTVVTVTGNNFTSDSTVTFSATNAPTVTFVNSNTLTVVSPVSSGTVHVIVTSPNGSSTPSGADAFNYYPTPVVTSISPTTGPEAGGTTVTINGEGFLTADTVTFGATAVPFTYVNDGKITADAPAGTGTVHLLVSGPGGASATSAADQFTFTPGPPTLTSVSPNQGPLAGGTSVVLTGSGFTGATAVTFGASAATFVVNTSTQITATAPAGTGTVDITVTTPLGSSATSAADQFGYLAAPTVTHITPYFGGQVGGEVVTITGTGFTAAATVAFGATSATAVTFVNSTTITATSPHAGGVVDIRITTPGGTSAITPPDQFVYYPPPYVTGVSPSSGPAAGGNTITITGGSFIGLTAVTFGGVPAISVSANSMTSLSVVVPAGTGTVDVRAFGFGVASPINVNDKYTYLPAPTVTGVSPASGPTGGGTMVTVTGTGFTGATAVHFGTVVSPTFTVDSATQITATAPSSLALTADITVTVPTGTSSAVASDQFTWVPGTLGLSANSVDAGGTVTVNGTGFAANASLDIVLHSTPVTLATVTTGPTGAFSATVTVPTGTAAGAHTIEVADASIALTVADPAAALASTGTDPTAPLGAAAGLLALGLLFSVVRRRRAAPRGGHAGS